MKKRILQLRAKDQMWTQNRAGCPQTRSIIRLKVSYYPSKADKIEER